MLGFDIETQERIIKIHKQLSVVLNNQDTKSGVVALIIVLKEIIKQQPDKDKILNSVIETLKE